VVGAGGVVTVPVIGPVPVGNLTADELSRDIAARMQSKLGLIEPPDATIEVISYPPIYVVGSVAQPGEYTFRPGMTVLQALALGGGQLRSETTESTASERLRLIAQLQSSNRGIARANLRIARLEAELADQLTIQVPKSEEEDPNLAQEKAVLAAAQTARDRQIASLDDLQVLYQQEISVLEARIADLEKTISSTETELAGVEQLVASGMATVSRRSELERLLSSLRSDRLEQKTAIMRARQYMTEAERNADGIEDTRRTSLTEQLLSERAELEQMELDVRTTEALLANLDQELLLDDTDQSNSEAALAFVIVRNTAGKVVQLPAGDFEVLLPADVVKVSISRSPSTASSR
jgi:superfamily II DNA helicase RecQ